MLFKEENFKDLQPGTTYKEVKFMYEFIKKHKLKKGLEIGHRQGWSTIWLSKALEENNGTLYTIDIKNWKNFRENIEIAKVNPIDFIGNTQRKDGINFIEENKPYDFIFIDGNHSYGGFNNDWLISKKTINDNGYIFIHDIKGAGGVDKGIERFCKEKLSFLIPVKETTEEFFKDKPPFTRLGYVREIDIP